MERSEVRNMEGSNSNKNKKQSSAAAAVDTAFEKSKKKKRKQPIKVVYISNPTKVKTTVAQFRSVFQELTGRDSDLYASLSRYGNGDGAATGVPPSSLVQPVKRIVTAAPPAGILAGTRVHFSH